MLGFRWYFGFCLVGRYSNFEGIIRVSTLRLSFVGVLIWEWVFRGVVFCFFISNRCFEVYFKLLIMVRYFEFILFFVVIFIGFEWFIMWERKDM